MATLNENNDNYYGYKPKKEDNIVGWQNNSGEFGRRCAGGPGFQGSAPAGVDALVRAFPGGGPAGG